MEIFAQEVCKKFGTEWIIKNFNHHFIAEKPCAILGGNGSGKSTLLKIIAGFMQPGKGNVIYKQKAQEIESSAVYQQISYAAPYLELVEEFTCIESIAFQQKFKPYINNISANEVLEISGLQNAREKALKVFSSGMKQRLKLTLAIMADCPVLMLDEPCSNLDTKAIDWYHMMLDKFAKDKLIIICSNHLQYEYQICNEQINTEVFK